MMGVQKREGFKRSNSIMVFLTIFLFHMGGLKIREGEGHYTGVSGEASGLCDFYPLSLGS